MRSSLVLVSIVCAVAAFDCWTCNSKKGDDDARPCNEVREKCEEGADSCSMVVYKKNGRQHMRKFCTSPGTPIYQYLLFFPGSALCQNINTSSPARVSPDFELVRAKRAAPPAPPTATTSSLLCVCMTPMCNHGSHEEMLERTMLSGISSRPSIASKSGPAPPQPKMIKESNDFFV